MDQQTLIIVVIAVVVIFFLINRKNEEAEVENFLRTRAVSRPVRSVSRPTSPKRPPPPAPRPPPRPTWKVGDIREGSLGIPRCKFGDRNSSGRVSHTYCQSERLTSKGWECANPDYKIITDVPHCDDMR